jgi:hypothetical protein
VFDGELIAFSEGQPDFVALCDRMLLRSDHRIPIAFVVFDVLGLVATDTMREPYRRRREILEDLILAGPHWSVTPSFSDGAALWKVVENQELEARREATWRCLQARRTRTAQGEEPGLEVRDRTRRDRRPASEVLPNDPPCRRAPNDLSVNLSR